MDKEKIAAWSGLIEKIAGLVALLCLTGVLIVAINHFSAEQIAGLLQDGRGAAIFAVSFLSAITLIVMLLNANLKSALQKVLLVLVGALAGLLGQPSLAPLTDEQGQTTSQMTRALHGHRAPLTWTVSR